MTRQRPFLEIMAISVKLRHYAIASGDIDDLSLYLEQKSPSSWEHLLLILRRLGLKAIDT